MNYIAGSSPQSRTPVALVRTQAAGNTSSTEHHEKPFRHDLEALYELYQGPTLFHKQKTNHRPLHPISDILYSVREYPHTVAEDATSKKRLPINDLERL